MRNRVVTQDEIDAMKRAADAARDAGDCEHERALRKAIRFNERLKREQEAGIDSPVAIWM